MCGIFFVRSKRFCAEDRGFLSEAGQFPFGKPLTGVTRPRIVLHHDRFGPDGQLRWYCKAGIAGDYAPRAVFLSLSSGPRCSASWLGMDQEAWFAGFDVVPRAVLLLVSQAPDARHHGRLGPQDSVEVHRCSSWTRFSPRPLLCSSVLVQTVLYTVWRFRTCNSSRSSFSCCGTEAYSMQTIVFPQLLRYMWSTSPVMQAVQFPRWFAVLGHADDMPLLVTTGVWSWTVSYCRGSAVAVLWWSLTSPSLQVQVLWS